MRITEVIKQGNRISGYKVSDANGVKQFTKDEVLNLIRAKQIDNASVQMWQGKPIIRVKDGADRFIETRGTSLPYHGMTIADSVVSSIKSNTSDELFGDELVKLLKNTANGIPLKLKLSDTLDWKQVIYMGEEFDSDRKQNTFRFFDGSGVSGIFTLSERFILNNKAIKAKFNDNEPGETAFLINYLQKGPFNIREQHIEDTSEAVDKLSKVSKINEYKKAQTLIDTKYYSFINRDYTEKGTTVKDCDKVACCDAISFEDAANKMKEQLAEALLARNNMKIHPNTKIKLNKLQKLPCIKSLKFVGTIEEMSGNVYYTKLTVQNGIIKLSETIFIAKRDR